MGREESNWLEVVQRAHLIYHSYIVRAFDIELVMPNSYDEFLKKNYGTKCICI